MIVTQVRLAARCANEYTITHNDTSIKTHPRFSETKLSHVPDIFPKIQYNNHARPNNINSDSKPLYLPTCTYHKKKGHIISNCFTLKRKQESKYGSHPSAFTSVKSGNKMSIEKYTFVGSLKPKSDILKSNEPFISGFITKW